MFIPARIWSGPTAGPITNGRDMLRRWEIRPLTLSLSPKGRGDIFCFALIVALVVLGGCAGLQTTTHDLQVMETAARAEFQQAQRTILDLRAEIQVLQRELGTARAAQARTEGDWRETERRLRDAQHVVDLQREEMAQARAERERLTQAGRDMQGQLAEMGNLRQQVADAARGQERIKTLEETVEKYAKEMADLKAALRRPATRSRQTPTSLGQIIPIPAGPVNVALPVGGPATTSQRTILVQRGDTLWDLARKYQVNLLLLKALNDLKTDLIVPGQELILP